MRPLALLWVLAGIGHGYQTGQAPSAEAVVRQTLSDHYARMDAATLAGDFDVLEALALPDATVLQGSRESRFSAILGQMRALVQTVTVVSHRSFVESLQVLGEEAKAVVRTESVVKIAGQNRTGIQRTEDTWSLTPDGWRIKRSVNLGAGELSAPVSADAAATVASDLRQYVRPADEPAIFASAVGEARIVGLGEATHGTEESAAVKARIVEHLVRHKGFGVLAVEGQWAGAAKLDEYINGGSGDPDTTLASMGWHLANRQMRTLLETLRSINRESPGSVRFAGFDMAWGDTARRYVSRFIGRTAPDQIETVEKWYAPLLALRPGSINPGAKDASASARRVAELLDRLRLQMIDTAGEPDWRRARHAAEIVCQSAMYLAEGQGANYRDEMMARNALWLLEEGFPGRKIILWAHNSHISVAADVASKPMGSRLRERFGKSYYALGFAVAGGQVRAQGPQGLSDYPMPRAVEGSGDWVLALTGLPSFFLDVKRLPDMSPSKTWLGQPHSFYSVGGMLNPEVQTANTAVFTMAKSFDGVIFFREGHAAKPNQARQDLE